ncbi:hypothetical protein NQ314_010124 [Rhamnusium bicolor]|uniref:VPS9 domain-containing protein n=1 Tax=Rhamnusium bicolor TaxID=1586634 RepID=A0AAV8XU65_9CUCU|nr:hypothetical protein NQ314_010124 [Rhamnusium bicolor]
MDMNGISSLSGSQTYLTSASSNENILEDIRNIIYTWKYKSEYNLNAIRNDLNKIIDEVILQSFGGKEDNDIFKAVSCIVYNEIYENLIPLIRGNFSKEDLFFYEKCQYFCKRNVTVGEFGSSIYNSVPFTSAVVELSILDNYKSPLEKINCLCSTYDLIFAELKLALVSLISKYSEKECEIPVINNEEIIPILMLVIIKSKLLYLPSNLFYIEFFADDMLRDNSNIRTILQVFQTVTQKIMQTEESSLKLCDDKLSPNLDVCETMEIMTFVENVTTNENDAVTLKDEEKRRLVSLITTSTAEKNFIPLDLPKLF